MFQEFPGLCKRGKRDQSHEYPFVGFQNESSSPTSSGILRPERGSQGQGNSVYDGVWNYGSCRVGDLSFVGTRI
jgi:hypothetical protein